MTSADRICGQSLHNPGRVVHFGTCNWPAADHERYCWHESTSEIWRQITTSSWSWI